MKSLSLFYTLLLIIKLCSTRQPKLYRNNETVVLYVNKVGPYYNPHETYHYYSLPVCRPPELMFKSLSLGEVLDGDRMAKSIYKINFKQNVVLKTLCHLNLKLKDMKRLINAIEDLYYFEFVIDDIPIRGFIGNLEESKLLPHTHKALLYTHHDIQIDYNGNNIIYANIFTTQSDPINLIILQQQQKSINITFTYSVRWNPSTIPVKDRANRISKTNFFPVTLKIHWISITNSLILVFLLMTFIMFIISRVLRRDFARYNRLNNVESTSFDQDEDQDEKGWKIIHNDVFRPPSNKLLFCSIVGTGFQLVVIALGIMLMAVSNMFNVHNHGSINIAALLLYSFTSWIAGFVSCRLYCMFQNTGVHLTQSSVSLSSGWVRVVNSTSVLFGMPLAIVWLVCNTVSVVYGTTHAMPFGTIVLLLLIWLVVGYPLTIAGGMLGRRTDARIDTNGCRARNIAREIPTVAWYKNKYAYLSLGGFLPFSSICIELYYIFSTIWGRDHYNLYGILFIIFFILLLVTICVAINLTYFQLVNEDYHWWWNTLQLAACSACFVFLYCVFHYFFRSKMSGFVQTIEYFSYSILICYAFFLGLGAVSFIASFHFIKFMYRNIKLD